MATASTLGVMLQNTMSNSWKSGWLRLKPPYITLQVMGDVQDKSDAYAALDQEDVDDYLQGILQENPITCDCQE